MRRTVLTVQEAQANRVGSCDFCTRHPRTTVWVVRNNDPDRRLEVRFCKTCLADLKAATDTSVH